MGRRCKTLLPIANSLLKPRYDTEAETRALSGMNQCQKFYYNKVAKPLEAILRGETVRRKLPGRDTWSPGTCASKLADRSYLVKVGDTEYRRNRRHIQKSNEPLAPKLLDDVTEPQTMSGDTAENSFTPEVETPTPDSNDKGPRRSSRCRRAPSWHQNYAMAGTDLADS